MFIIGFIIGDGKMKYITVGVIFIVLITLLSDFLTLPCVLFMLCFSAVVMSIGVITEIKGGRK